MQKDKIPPILLNSWQALGIILCLKGVLFHDPFIGWLGAIMIIIPHISYLRQVKK